MDQTRSKRLSSTLCLLLAAVFLAPVARAVEFRVDGTKILRDGREFIIQGANINGPGWVWERSAIPDAALIVDTWRFNTVRVNCRLIPAAQGNTDTLAAIVEAFTSRGCVTILEAHDFTGKYATATSSPTLAQLKDWWVDVATQFKDNPYVWFNIVNEPGGTGPVPADWLTMHTTCIDAIRATGATNVIVCDDHEWGTAGVNGRKTVDPARSGVLTYGPQLLQGRANIAFSFHVYHQWNTGGVALFQDYFDRAAALGLSVHAGEFGQSPFTAFESVTATTALLQAARPNRIGRIVWAWYGGDSNRLVNEFARSPRGGGWWIDRTDGSRPTNLSWLGELVWDDNHGLPLEPIDGRPTPYDRTGWTATAFATGPDEQTPTGSGSTPTATDPVPPGDVLDGSYGRSGNLSRWRPGVNLEDGQWLEIDMKERRQVARVDVSAQFATFAPAGYKIYVHDGTPGEPVAEQRNSQSEKRIAFGPVTGRYVRIETTGGAGGQPWEVREVNVYDQPGAAAVLEPLPPSAPGARLVNLSSRGYAGHGQDVLAAGFVIAGPASKRLLIRAAGPALAPFLSGALPKPVVGLRRVDGVPLRDERGWENAAGSAEATRAEFARLGAFGFAAGSTDAALIVTLPPGLYTALVYPDTGTEPGISLVEVYDTEPADAPSRLLNVSTRARNGRGERQLIVGFVTQGGATRLLVRGVGPRLGAYGVSDWLADPNLELYATGGARVADNKEWWAGERTREIARLADATRAFPLAYGEGDAALALRLNDGGYTAMTNDGGGGDGTVLIEVYDAR